MKNLTVKELIQKLKKFPENNGVIFYEKGSIYDILVTNVYVSEYDKKNKLNRVTLSNS